MPENSVYPPKYLNVFVGAIYIIYLLALIFCDFFFLIAAMENISY